MLKALGELVKTTKDIIDFINDVKGAKNDKLSLLAEITATSAILEQLEQDVKNKNFKLTVKVLAKEGGVLKSLKSEVDKLHKMLKSRIRGASIAWPLFKAGALKHAESIHRLSNTLSHALQHDLAFVYSTLHLISEPLRKP